MVDFRTKVVLITGGTSGIGRATAVAFGKAGANVVVTGRRAAECEETVRLIQMAGGHGLAVMGDVSREADVQRMVAQTTEKFGRLDFAFNNAGIEQEMQALPEQTEATFDRVMGINAKGVWLCMKHEIPAMLTNAGGAIVNNASVAGLIGMALAPIYAASKHAVVGLTRSVALDYARQNIRVNAVAPGGVATDMIERLNTPETKARLASWHPMGRLGTPEEIADAVLWLCSDGASFVTGQTLAIDGGFTIR